LAIIMLIIVAGDRPKSGETGIITGALRTRRRRI